MGDTSQSNGTTCDSSHEEHVRAILKAQRRRHALEEKRSHHRKKQAIQALRQEFQQLQQMYETLCLKADQQQWPQQPRLEISISYANRLPLTALAQQISSLHQANSKLRRSIEIHEHSHETLRALVLDNQVERPLAIGYCASDRSRFHYVPFTKEQCYEIIRKASEPVMRRPGNWFDPNMNKQLRFGWQGDSVVESDTRFRYQYSKVVPVHPDVCFGVFMSVLNKNGGRRPGYAFPHNVEVLQRVSDDIIVIRRTTTMLDGGLNYAVTIVYRMRIDDSYLLGYLTQPLWGNGPSTTNNDPYGKSLLRNGERLMLNQRFVLLEPVAATSVGHDDPLVMYTQFHRWGYCVCENERDAAFWTNELFDMGLRFEYLWLRPLVGNQIQGW